MLVLIVVFIRRQGVQINLLMMMCWIWSSRFLEFLCRFQFGLYANNFYKIIIVLLDSFYKEVVIVIERIIAWDAMANLEDLFAQLKASLNIYGAKFAPSEANTSINLKESSRIGAGATCLVPVNNNSTINWSEKLAFVAVVIAGHSILQGGKDLISYRFEQKIARDSVCGSLPKLLGCPD